MSDLTHLFTTGQLVRCELDGKLYKGTVVETDIDHLIIDVPSISCHCWFESGFNLDKVFPEYNFDKGVKK